MRKKINVSGVAALTLLMTTMALIPNPSSAEASSVSSVVANTYIGDAGTMVESFDIAVDDISKYDRLQASDFDITGNYNGYPLNEAGEIVQNDYTNDGIELSIKDQMIHMKVESFRYPGGNLAPFAVKSSTYPELSFTKDNVTKVNTRTVDDFKSSSFTASNGATLPYRFKETSSTEPQPLVVWLHGGGEFGTDNTKQLTENRGATVWKESGQDTSVLAVQYPQNYGWAIYNNPVELSQMQAYFTLQYELIQQLVDEGKVDPQRIYLVGVSSGGGGALRFMMQYPDLFAGSIVIAAKDAVADYKGSVEPFKQALQSLTNVPIWLIHAENDPTTDSRTTKLSYQALTELGSTQVKETLYSDEWMKEQHLYDKMLHWSWVPALNNAEVIDWLFDQSRSNSVANSKLAADKMVTRAQLADALAYVLKLSESTSTTPFVDIVSSDMTKPIQQVVAQGLMKGTTSTTFAPDEQVTRAQLATVISNWSKITKPSIEIKHAKISTDVPQQHWAYSSIVDVLQMGLMENDTTNQFHPAQLVTGQEVNDLLSQM